MPAYPEPARRAGPGRRHRRTPARLYGAVLALAAIPLLTLALVAARPHLDLADDLLIYLVVVVATAVIGGFWPAVLTAVASSLLLNWYFTPPLHNFTIEEPRNLLALVLFVTVAVAVSSVVHLAARRALQAAHSREEAASLLALAQTVLGGADTPDGRSSSTSPAPSAAGPNCRSGCPGAGSRWRPAACPTPWTARSTSRSATTWR